MCTSERHVGNKRKILTLLIELKHFDSMAIRRILLSFYSISLVMFILVSSCIYQPAPAFGKLYNCEKNGTIVISSEPCQAKHRRRSKKLGKSKTCFLQDLNTLEQSLVSNPSRKQLKRSRVIWCKNRGQSHFKSQQDQKDASPNSFRARSPKRYGKRNKSGGHNLPKRASAFKEYVQNAAKLYDLPEALLWAFMKVESDFIPSAVSRVGAQGLMQLMPFTAKDMGVNDPFNPEQNIFGAAKLISILMKRFNSELPLVISAYHAGGGAVTKKEGIPYTQTSQYMTSVLNAYYRYMKSPPYAKRD